MSLTVQDGLNGLTQYFRNAGIENPARDARLLLAHVLGVDPGRMTLLVRDLLSEDVLEAAYAKAAARKDRRPMSHITGARDFYGRRFLVDERVLDPRPETECLIEAALRQPFHEVLDLGTGSGCILLSLLAERPEATGIGTDISAAALEVAQRNADALGVVARCALMESNWFDSVGGEYDLIVSNPPYIAVSEIAELAPELAYEPRMALTDEGDGLGAYRIIVPGAPAHLRAGGRLMVEIGWTQGHMVAGMFAEAGFTDVQILPDLDGRDRVIKGVWPG